MSSRRASSSRVARKNAALAAASAATDGRGDPFAPASIAWTGTSVVGTAVTAGRSRPARRPAARRDVDGDARALKRTLRQTFGIETLRSGQEEVIARVLARRDTIAVMPTGAGKSLCYQLPALHLPGTTVVVSPLIALMKDQADKLVEAGVAVESLNSTLSDGEAGAALDRIRGRETRIVFVTPERLTDEGTLAALRECGIALFVVDEAHCISQWGHDFRPAYLELRPALAALGDPPVLCLTATATDAVIEDIGEQLGRRGLRAIRTGVYRSNLLYAVRQVTNEDERTARVVDIARTTPGSGIVYTATVRAADSLHEALLAAGVEATRYHGQLSGSERHDNQDAFMNGSARVVVATNAFGLGVDKPDIRFVLHAQMPASLEAYYQESGRGGRDGDAAHCTLLYDLRDKRVQQFFLVGRYPDAEAIQAVDEAVVRLASTSPVAFDVLRASLPEVAAVKIRVALSLLEDARMLERLPGATVIALDRPRRPGLYARLAQGYVEKSELDREKLERMVFYAQTGYCRWRVLVEYFGESLEGDRCGRCDNCRRDAKRDSPVEAAATPLRQPRRATRRRAFVAGEGVRVPRYGEGRVQRAAGDEVTVEFADGAVRTFLASYVRPAAAASLSAAAD